MIADATLTALLAAALLLPRSHRPRQYQRTDGPPLRVRTGDPDRSAALTPAGWAAMGLNDARQWVD